MSSASVLGGFWAIFFSFLEISVWRSFRGNLMVTEVRSSSVSALVWSYLQRRSWHFAEQIDFGKCLLLSWLFWQLPPWNELNQMTVSLPYQLQFPFQSCFLIFPVFFRTLVFLCFWFDDVVGFSGKAVMNVVSPFFLLTTLSFGREIFKEILWSFFNTESSFSLEFGQSFLSTSARNVWFFSHLYSFFYLWRFWALATLPLAQISVWASGFL